MKAANPGRAPLSRSTKALSALGVLAAVVIAVNANILVARFYERWDFTSERLYTLSPATTSLLATLDRPISVAVLLSRTDPLLTPIRQLLVAYGAETQKLEVRYVDPEQSPAEFMALQQKYGILAGKADDGRVVTDAVILLARGDRTWFVTADELSTPDEEGRARPRLEQALSEGIASVTAGEKAKLCFATGHGEASLDDVSPAGLAELRRRVEKSNFVAEPLELTRPDAEKTLKSCRLLVIAGPETPYGADAAERAQSFVAAGGSAVVFAGPLIGEDGRVAVTGLERLAELGGVRIGANIVLETDASRRLPRGAGETFFATPVEHAVTRGLVLEGGKVELRVVVSESRSLEALPNSRALPLLKSSQEALALEDVKAVLGGGATPEGRKAERVLAMAVELPRLSGSKEKHGPRLVVAGSSDLPRARSFRDPALAGDRLLVENALAWAAARPPIVGVPEKPARELGLALTEESLGEVLRYVLIYMPGAAAMLGVLILLGRRSKEKNSRQPARRGAA
ncbi:MAG TPA: GldG family protein [Polyangiaceae bacterium]